jgi:hypothetical protein
MRLLFCLPFSSLIGPALQASRLRDKSSMAVGVHLKPDSGSNRRRVPRGDEGKGYVAVRVNLHSRPARPELPASVQQRFDLLAPSSRLCVAKISVIRLHVVIH